MKVSVAVDVDTIVRQLPLREKIRLVRQLERETWASELGDVVSRIRSRRSIRQLSAREIARLVEDVRRARVLRASHRP